MRRALHTFDVVPDAPASRFLLKLFGGKRGLFLSTLLLCLLALPSSSPAASPLKVREVFPGSTSTDLAAEFVELQMTAAGQNDTDGQVLRFYDASGTETSSFTIPADVANGQSQRTVLLATQEAIDDIPSFPAADFNIGSGASRLNPAGGAVCFTGAGSGQEDCVTWGSIPLFGALSSSPIRKAPTRRRGGSTTAKPCGARSPPAAPPTWSHPMTPTTATTTSPRPRRFNRATTARPRPRSAALRRPSSRSSPTTRPTRRRPSSTTPSPRLSRERRSSARLTGDPPPIPSRATSPPARPARSPTPGPSPRASTSSRSAPAARGARTPRRRSAAGRSTPRRPRPSSTPLPQSPPEALRLHSPITPPNPPRPSAASSTQGRSRPALPRAKATSC